MNSDWVYMYTADAVWKVSPELDSAIAANPTLKGYHSDSPVREDHPDFKKWESHFEFVRWVD